MKTHTTERASRPSRLARAEAASWVARLHGPDRNADVESGLKRWLSEDPAHQEAFELATEVWQETADLPCDLARPAAQRHSRSRRVAAPRVHLAAWVASFVSMVGAALIFHAYFGSGSVLTTDVGEQRTLTLADGTRVQLNTSSELVTKFDDRVRTVTLKSGEAYFDVVRQPQRPFVVKAGEREIVALGTSFLVRRDLAGLTVTLLEGRVSVATSDNAGVPGEEVRVLKPGQRLKIASDDTPVLDSPSIDKVTAWQRGQIIFEDTTLAEAAAEFNRYSVRRLRLGSPDLGRIRVGGMFRTGDLSSFVGAVAESNQLSVLDGSDEIVLLPAASE